MRSCLYVHAYWKVKTLSSSILFKYSPSKSLAESHVLVFSTRLTISFLRLGT